MTYYFLVKPPGGLIGRTRKVSRGAVILEGPFVDLAGARVMRASSHYASGRTAIASREVRFKGRLKWVEGDTWMLTDSQRAKLAKTTEGKP